VFLKNGDRQCGKFFGVETGVVSDKQAGFRGFCFDVFGDSGDGKSNAGERKIVGDESTPAGGAKFDGGNRHARGSAHSGCSVARTGRGEKRGKTVTAGMTWKRRKGCSGVEPLLPGLRAQPGCTAGEIEDGGNGCASDSGDVRESD